MAGSASGAVETAAVAATAMLQGLLHLLSRFEEEGLDVGVAKREGGLAGYKLHFGLPPEADEQPETPAPQGGASTDP